MSGIAKDMHDASLARNTRDQQLSHDLWMVTGKDLKYYRNLETEIVNARIAAQNAKEELSLYKELLPDDPNTLSDLVVKQDFINESHANLKAFEDGVTNAVDSHKRVGTLNTMKARIDKRTLSNEYIRKEVLKDLKAPLNLVKVVRNQIILDEFLTSRQRGETYSTKNINL